MNAKFKRCAISLGASIAVGATTASAIAQSTQFIHVNIESTATNPDGLTWGNAFPYLQDGLDAADIWLAQFDEVEIWVAAGTYLPTQGGPDVSCHDGWGHCAQCCSFRLRDNVRILGGFPTDPHTWNNGQGADLNDRDPATYETILSGDLDENDAFCQSIDPDGPGYDEQCPAKLHFGNYEDNSATIVIALNVGRTAMLDGFTIQGGIELRGARPLFRDCVIALHEGAAVRCADGSHVVFHRCTFIGSDCDAIIVDEGSRLELLACEPATALAEAQTTGKASVGACSLLLVVDEAAMMR